LKQAKANKKWMEQNGNRPVVKSAMLYIDAREKMVNALMQRDRTGGSRSLTAKSNQDLANAWDTFVAQLGAESPEFSDFYNRYFTNDPVVV
jgi:hypothetical protein